MGNGLGNTLVSFAGFPCFAGLALAAEEDAIKSFSEKVRAGTEARQRPDRAKAQAADGRARADAAEANVGELRAKVAELAG